MESELLRTDWNALDKEELVRRLNLLEYCLHHRVADESASLDSSIEFISSRSDGYVQAGTYALNLARDLPLATNYRREIK